MANLIFRFRWFIITFCSFAGILSLVSIPHIKTDPDIRNYIPGSIDSKAATDSIENMFGVQDMVIILFSDDSVLNSDNLNRIKAIDRSISRLSGVSDRISPFTVKSIKSEEGMMVVEPLIIDIPADTSEVSALKNDILKNSFARNIVFSSDLTVAAITATISAAEPEKLTLQKIDSVINSFPGKASVLKGGLPYIRKYLLDDVNKDALILVPAALMIMLLVLKINLGTWKSVFLPFSIVVLTAAFSMALIPLAGWKMSIITLLVPVILIAVANNYGIYLVARYQELTGKHPGISRDDLVSDILRSLNTPILFSGLTTVAGLLGLLMHSIIPARQVGILSAAGVTAALLMSLTLIPAMIFTCGTGQYLRKGNAQLGKKLEYLLARLSSLIIERNGAILIISVTVIVMFAAGIFLVRINTNQETYFSQKHPVRKASAIINSKFGGSQTISVMLEGDILDPDVMEKIDRITTETSRQKGVGNVFSISQVIREMSKAIYTKDEDGYDAIPATREGIAQMFELYNMSGNPEDYKRLMDLEYTKAHIMIRLSEPENDIIKNIRSEIEGLSSGFQGKVTIGGYALIMADFANSLIRGQVTSLIFAASAIFLLVAIVFRSVKGGLTGSIPLLISIVVLFGFMGFSGIALDAATALLSSLMIGVGVDFTIQYLWCFNLMLGKGLSYSDATLAAMRTIGRSIIINAIGVMSGFAALIFSGFTSIRFFGYLVIISIGTCLLGALIIIPSILLRYKPSFLGFETTKYKKNEDFYGNFGASSGTPSTAGPES
jgi:predicted RND superfamily exporter protein